MLHKVLPLGLQFRLMEVEIINCANTENALPWKSCTNTIHEGAASLAEVVGHEVLAGDGARLAKSGQVIAAAGVSQVFVVNGKVGREHRCGDFAAVCAVADKRVDKARPLGRLWLMWLETREQMMRCANVRLTNSSWTAPQ
jgi:hypothetical protein